ncbi:glycosyltransferase [bacterium]|nr:glycosyltransferase [bacterium]
MSEELAARSHRVSVVTTDMGCEGKVPVNRWVTYKDYRVWYLPTWPTNRIAPYFHFGCQRVLDALPRESLIIHLHCAFVHLNAQAAKWARRKGIPYVYSPRGALDPNRLRYKRLGKKLFFALFENQLINRADYCHAVSRAEIGHLRLQGVPDGKIVHIPNAVRKPDFDVKRAAVSFRRQNGLGESDFVMLHLGQLVWYKGVHLLLKSALALKPEFPEITAVLAGPDAGAEAERSRYVRANAMDDYVIFTGHLHGQEKWAAFAAADLFCLLSESEGLPNAVLESMAVGTPALISEACNIPEVSDYGAGWVVNAEHCDAVNALRRALEDQSGLSHLARASIVAAHETFSPDVVSEEYVNVFSPLAIHREAFQ